MPNVNNTHNAKIFGIFDGHGINGDKLSQEIRDYFIEFFSDKKKTIGYFLPFPAIISQQAAEHLLRLSGATRDGRSGCGVPAVRCCRRDCSVRHHISGRP